MVWICWVGAGRDTTTDVQGCSCRRPFRVFIYATTDILPYNTCFWFLISCVVPTWLQFWQPVFTLLYLEASFLHYSLTAWLQFNVRMLPNIYFIFSTKWTERAMAVTLILYLDLSLVLNTESCVHLEKLRTIEAMTTFFLWISHCMKQ